MPLDSQEIAECEEETSKNGVEWKLNAHHVATLTDVMVGIWALTTAIYEVARQVAKFREEIEGLEK